MSNDGRVISSCTPAHHSVPRSSNGARPSPFVQDDRRRQLGFAARIVRPGCTVATTVLGLPDLRLAWSHNAAAFLGTARRAASEESSIVDSRQVLSATRTAGPIKEKRYFTNRSGGVAKRSVFPPRRWLLLHRRLHFTQQVRFLRGNGRCGRCVQRWD